jgi:dTDP-4-dehydrorhamnose reductase
MLRLASQREELRVVDDQIGAPTWCRTIAVATAEILSRFFSSYRRSSELEKFSGVYHLASAGETSWYGFAQAIFEECSDSCRLGAWFQGLTGGQPLIARRLVPIPTREYRVSAHRPAYSVLTNAKLSQSFEIRLPDWRRQLQMALIDTTAQEIEHLIAGESH